MKLTKASVAAGCRSARQSASDGGRAGNSPRGTLPTTARPAHPTRYRTVAAAGFFQVTAGWTGGEEGRDKPCMMKLQAILYLLEKYITQEDRRGLSGQTGDALEVEDT